MISPKAKHAATASIKKPIHNVKEAGRSRIPDQIALTGTVVFISGVIDRTGGAYRDRTDDPLLAKQVLSQLS